MPGNSHLSKYWFEFEALDWETFPPCCRGGIGVTAFNVDDAVQLFQSGPFRETPMPETLHIRENASIADLDQNHVVPNMKPAIFRGIWYPAAYFEDHPLR